MQEGFARHEQVDSGQDRGARTGNATRMRQCGLDVAVLVLKHLESPPD